MVSTATVTVNGRTILIRCETIPHRRSHRRIGMIQMILGSICLLISACGFFFVVPEYQFYGGGILSGTFFIITGFLGFLTAKLNTIGLVIACLPVNINAAFVAVGGLILATIELMNGYAHDANDLRYQYAKCIIVIIIAPAEFFIAIVHTVFAVKSLCQLTRQAMAETDATTRPHGNTVANPTQMYYGLQPQQQYGRQIMSQGQVSCEPQGAVDDPPSYENAVFSHETPGPISRNTGN